MLELGERLVGSAQIEHQAAERLQREHQQRSVARSAERLHCGPELVLGLARPPELHQQPPEIVARLRDLQRVVRPQRQRQDLAEHGLRLRVGVALRE